MAKILKIQYLFNLLLSKNQSTLSRHFLSSKRNSSMELSAVVGVLDKIAPLKLAESWDNVGLLVEPTPPHKVEKIFLTIDLTEEVMCEAVEEKADLIITYHPLIFRPLKRITSKYWKERIVSKALENRLAIYSPHTACDAIKDGVNDWLASGLGKHSSLQPITSKVEYPVSGALYLLKTSTKSETFHEITFGLKDSMDILNDSGNATLVHIKTEGQSKILENMSKHNISNSLLERLTTSSLPSPVVGLGRICELQEATPLKLIVKRLKQHLNIDHLRLALGSGKTEEGLVQTFAMCAGSGGSVLSGCQADVFLSGEMSHHEVLDATQNGTSVILCEHTNTERGYLKLLKGQLHKLLNHELPIEISKQDRDPLVTV